VGQLSFLVSTRTLAALGDAFVTYNFCAWRVTDFVLGGFVVSITRAILPSLSDQALETDRTAYRGTIAFALRLIGFITIPSTVGLILLATPLIDVVFRRGRFGTADVDKTALAVGFFALGLFAAAGVKILTQAFYALHDTRTPVLVATFDLAAFWILCVALAGPMQHAGVALATAAGFWINFLILLVLLRQRLGGMGGRAILASLFRLVLASLAMGAVVWTVAAKLVPYRMIWTLPLRMGWVGAVAALGTVAFLAFAKLLGAPEVDEVLGGLRRKRTTP
jgi:putative peptidoglycan lipid II flippase